VVAAYIVFLDWSPTDLGDSNLTLIGQGAHRWRHERPRYASMSAADAGAARDHFAARVSL
jgi:hypothetical protein